MRGWGGDKGGTMKKDSRNAGSSRPAEPYAARSRHLVEEAGVGPVSDPRHAQARVGHRSVDRPELVVAQRAAYGHTPTEVELLRAIIADRLPPFGEACLQASVAPWEPVATIAAGGQELLQTVTQALCAERGGRPNVRRERARDGGGEVEGAMSGLGAYVGQGSRCRAGRGIDGGVRQPHGVPPRETVHGEPRHGGPMGRNDTGRPSETLGVAAPEGRRPAEVRAIARSEHRRCQNVGRETQV